LQFLDDSALAPRAYHRELRISVNAPTHTGSSCPLAHEMVLRG
jgi:hypothetical protein